MLWILAELQLYRAANLCGIYGNAKYGCIGYLTYLQNIPLCIKNKQSMPLLMPSAELKAVMFKKCLLW